MAPLFRVLPGGISGYLAFVLFLMPLSASYAATALEKLNTVENAGFVLTDNAGNILSSRNEHHAFIPASTTKLITAWLALEHWGENHRFTTKLHFDKFTSTLWITGSGDPFLVSEELVLMAQQIQQWLENSASFEIAAIGLDVSLFDADLVVPGATTTNNPYDAVPTSIAANFNTLNLKRENGQLKSAESQTPLTRFSRSFSKDIVSRSLRINTGRQSAQSEQYFAELLAELLRSNHLSVGKKIIWGKSPDRPPDILYVNTQTLRQLLQAMLKYSTNFIANQLILTLVAEARQQPANFEHVQDYVEARLRDHFNWKDITLLEGAGLSRKNRLTPVQMIDLLLAFKPWQSLLPEVAEDVFAKTGTLTGVSALAGYLQQQNGSDYYFALFINDDVPERFTRDLALELASSIRTR